MKIFSKSLRTLSEGNIIMIDILGLEQYFPNVGTPVAYSDFTFTIKLDMDTDKDTFIINLKIQQRDTKQDHLIKFRLGMGKDNPVDCSVHDTSIPHFEIDYYKRDDNSLAATIYFTFDKIGDNLLSEYAKGTVVIIAKILDAFINNHSLSKDTLGKLVYYGPIMKDLSAFEDTLLQGLHECYDRSNMVVRKDGERIVITSKHNLKKYLDIEDLRPLYSSLSTRIIP